MGRVAWLDVFAGLAGDMTVAALVSAGAEEKYVLDGLTALGVPGWQARFDRVHRGPFAALQFVVTVEGDRRGHDEEHGHHHGHDHDHDHGHDHGVHSPAGTHSRAWRDIRAILVASALPVRARDRALATFGRLAIAEGRVHGMEPDDVTFHEVGAIDSIVDIVGACLAMESLDIDRIVVSPIPLGVGGTRSEHGWIPLPAPATAELLRGFPVSASPWPGETVTPTGAALLAALARPGPLPAMRIDAIGYGAGTRNPSTHPNVLRVIIGTGDAGAVTTVCELRAELDGITGEAVPPLLDALFAAGAVDASATAITMKKGRPGLRIVALAPPGQRAAVGDALLRHGRTLGYRWMTLDRDVLARRHVAVTTPFGDVRIKLGEREGAVVHAAPEYADCAACALAANVPVIEVQAAALAAWHASLPPRNSG